MSSLLEIAQSAARNCGLNVTRASNTLEHKRSEILRRYDISLVLDVGANLGQYAHWIRRTGYLGRIVSFEPVAATFGELERTACKDPCHECRHLALGDDDVAETIHVSQGHASSSILRATSSLIAVAPSTRQVASEETRVARLDTIRTGVIRETDRVYLKIDTQGFEDRVIRGAVESMRQVYAIEVELSLAELYERQATLPDVWDMILRSGFRPIWIERGLIDPSTGFMLQCDAVFVRSETASQHGMRPEGRDTTIVHDCGE